MSTKQFYSWLMVVSIITGFTLFILYQLVDHKAGYFPWLGFSFFVFFSILIFHLGKPSASSTNKNKFTSVVMGMIFLKLVFTLVIVIGFDKLVEKVQIHHVVSFLISYLFFTFYEVYFMSKLARLS